MTKLVVEAIKEECRKKGIKYIRLDTGLDEKAVRKIYLNAGFKKEEIMEEGFSEEALSEMIGWDDNLNNPVQTGFLVTDNVVTSVSYNFVKFGLKFGAMLGIDLPSKTFGI